MLVMGWGVSSDDAFSFLDVFGEGELFMGAWEFADSETFATYSNLIIEADVETNKVLRAQKLAEAEELLIKDRKSTRLNSSHIQTSRITSSA